MGVCSCLQICNSVVNMLVMGLVLGQNLMVIYTYLVLSFYVKKYFPIILYCDFC